MSWTLTGTDYQQGIAAKALAAIKFPLDRLTQLPGSPELGWDDLNARAHGGHHSAGEDRADPLVGTDEKGRRYTMGVIYTASGRIYLDARLEAQPSVAMAVVAAEIGHAVDFFLPMTDAQRDELLRLWGRPGTTWWEEVDYGAEYFRIGGEAWMHEFVAAYTDLDFGDKSAFLHDTGVEPADVRRILGIERTDFVPPLPPAPPADFIRYGRSKVYHRPSHKLRGTARTITDTTGLRPCKRCKPE